MADGLFARIARDAREGVVHVDDGSVRVGDGDALARICKNAGRQLQLLALLRAFGHIDERAHHHQGLAVGVALRHPSAPLAPEPVALSVAYALVDLELRSLALEAGAQAVIKGGQVLWLGALAPLLDGGGLQICGLVSEQACQHGVGVQRAGTDVPGPQAHLGDLHGLVGAFLGFLQRVVLGLQCGLGFGAFGQQSVELLGQLVQLCRARGFGAGGVVSGTQALHRCGQRTNGALNAPCQHERHQAQAQHDQQRQHRTDPGALLGLGVHAAAGLAKIRHPVRLGNGGGVVKALDALQALGLELLVLGHDFAGHFPVGACANGFFGVVVAPQQGALRVKHTIAAVFGQALGGQAGVQCRQIQGQVGQAEHLVLLVTDRQAQHGHPLARDRARVRIPNAELSGLQCTLKPGFVTRVHCLAGRQWFGRAHHVPLKGGGNKVGKPLASAQQVGQQGVALRGIQGTHCWAPRHQFQGQPGRLQGAAHVQSHQGGQWPVHRA